MDSDSGSPSASPPAKTQPNVSAINHNTTSEDSSNIMRDVRRLIFDRCGDNSVWESLAEDDDDLRRHRQQRSGSRRAVHIREDANLVHEDMELLQIPPGLGLLFFAAQADGQTKSSPNLMKLLLIAAAPPLPEDPCHRLYTKHHEQLAKRQASLDAITQRLLDEEMKECTFRPIVSEVAQKMAPKGAEEFAAKCKEWKEHAQQKLLKKAEREAKEKEEEQMKQWKMNKHSKRLAARAADRRKKADDEAVANGEEEGGAVQRSSPTRQASSSPYGGAAQKFRREPKVAEQYSFEPITNTARLREAYITGGPSPKSRAARSGGDTPGERDVNDGPAQTTASHIVQRLQEDIKAREVRAAERKKRYEAVQKERLYDNETGQPLFVPNATPSKSVGKNRVPFHELPPDEQKQMKAKLSKMGMSFIVRASMRNRANEPTRNIEDIVAAMADRSKRAETHMEKIKRNDIKERDDWFHPKLDSSSLKMAAARVPPHEQELPTKPPPPPELKKPASSKTKMDEMLLRTEQWTQSRKTRMQRAHEKVVAEELADCTFKPLRANREALLSANGMRSHSPASSRSESQMASRHAAKEQEYVSAAEIRMRNELELLRNHPAHQDPLFAQGLRSASTTNGGSGGPIAAAHLFRTSSTRKTQHYEHSSAEVVQRYTADGSAEQLQQRAVVARSVTSYSAQPAQPLLTAATPYRASGGAPSHSHDVTIAWTSPLPVNPQQPTTAAAANYSQPPPFLASTRPAADPMAALDAGVGELEQLLDSWQELERETDNILDLVSAQ
jgi:hypothetical protein